MLNASLNKTESEMLFSDRVSAHCAIGHRINPSWWMFSVISRSNQYSMTGVIKAVVCAILSVGWCI